MSAMEKEKEKEKGKGREIGCRLSGGVVASAMFQLVWLRDVVLVPASETHKDLSVAVVDRLNKKFKYKVCLLESAL